MEQMLPMTILDAEYQFDRHKLTYYFEADRRIDFRELVSELFSLYKTRIWMQQVDTSVLGMNDAGLELAKATGFLPERDDHAYLATSHMHRSEGLHDGGHSFSGGGGGGGGYAGHSDTRSLQYSSPQLSQHHQPPQHMRGQSPGQRVDSGFQSPLYGGAASTWGSPHAQQYQPSFGQPSMGGARASPGYGQIGGQMRNEPNRNLMSPQDQLASSGTGNTGFAYGSAGLLDTPLAPLTRPQPPVMRPTRMQPVAPYPAMQPSPGLYQVGTAVAPPPAPQGSQLLQQPYFGNYGPPQQAAVTTGPQDDFYASYFQPAAAPRTPDAYGGSQRQDTTYYPPLESHYSTRNQHDQYIQEEQPFSASSAPTSAATGGNSGGGGAIDEGGGEDGQKDEGDGDLEGGGVEDSASLNTLIEQWSLRDPR